MPKDVLNKVQGFGSTVKEIMITYIVPVVVATNTFNIIWNKGLDNAEQIEYNDQKDKRRIEHGLDILTLKLEVQRQKDLREQEQKLFKVWQEFGKFRLEESQEDVEEWSLKYKELK